MANRSGRVVLAVFAATVLGAVLLAVHTTGKSSALLQMAPMNALRYDTEVPYPEENALGQPSNNGKSWMGTNVAYIGANGGGYGLARKPTLNLAPMRSLRYDTQVPYPNENALGQPSNNAQSWMGTNVAYAGANGGGYGWARKPTLNLAPMRSLRYDTQVPYPNENALGQPSNNAQSWMGTNVAYAGANGGGYGWARKPKATFSRLAAAGGRRQAQGRLQALGLETRSLPAGRHAMSDGVQTDPKCPGAWCDETPFRVYPDGREGFTGDAEFPLHWGPCNIAIQDC